MIINKKTGRWGGTILTRQEEELRDKVLSPVQYIKQLSGYFYVNPFLSVSLIITLFSFGGLPPLVGFYAKMNVIVAGLDSSYVFLSLLAVITSVIGAYYYLNIIIEIAGQSSGNDEEKLVTGPTLIISKSSKLQLEDSPVIPAAISILTMLISLYMFYSSNSWLSICPPRALLII